MAIQRSKVAKPAASDQKSQVSQEPGPVLPTVLSPFETINGRAQTITNQAMQLSDPEKVQKAVSLLDALLKDIAELQGQVGKCRKQIGSHLSQLRKVNPKGKPSEGEIRVLPNGASVIYLGGSWQPYVANATEGSLQQPS